MRYASCPHTIYTSNSTEVHCRSKHSKVVGYTLMELLVCMAIIALLGAILFTAFAPVRERTSETRCVSNFHQIYLALQMYRQDAGGEDPPAAHTAAEIGLPGNMGLFIHERSLESVFKCSSAFYNRPRDQWPRVDYNTNFLQYEDPSWAPVPKFSEMVAKHGMDTIIFSDAHHGTLMDKNNVDPKPRVLLLRLSGKAEFKNVNTFTPSWDW